MPRTFSDNWYRIADLRLELRPGVSIRLHHYRGEPWYVLHERVHAGFFRVNPLTYRFLNRLTVAATVHEIWRQAVNEAPEETPGQEEIFELVVSLYRANLLYVEGGVDESKILERSARKKEKSLAARLSELLFLKLPLWDPNRWLNRRLPLIDRLFSWPAGVAAGIVTGWGVVEFLLASAKLWSQAANILQFNNLILLYVAVFFSHLLHELAHAAACKYFGGNVRTMGIMLLMLTPLPYADVSTSWTFRSRWHRVLVDAAGMLIDLLTGAVATIVWVYSPPGTVNELAYNLIFAIWVHTFIFNLNPLMRFDGYYILSDLIEIPNLHEQAKQAFREAWSRMALSSTDHGEEEKTGRHAALLLFYFTSNAYRIMVMFGIILFVADQYFGVGLMAAMAMTVTSFLVPMQRMLAPLKNPLFVSRHKRLLRSGATLLTGMAMFLLFVPVPDSRVLDGVVEAVHDTPIHAESAGIVQEVLAFPGQWVEQGSKLVLLSNPELAHELESVAAQRKQARIQESKALTEGGVDLDPIRERLRSLEASRRSLDSQLAALIVRSPHTGVWVPVDSHNWRGSWVGRGTELGRVIDDRQHRFVGVVRQESALALVALQGEGSTVRIEGERELAFAVEALTLVPHSQATLPSAVLTPLAGGKMPIKSNDPSGKQSVEPFFLLRANLVSQERRIHGDPPRVGRAAWIKVGLEARPLAEQGWQALRQFMQRRYAL
ncbi:MAG: hypothetical protein HQM03_14550 [Magnetococcales bacterium]|nr:hypothetical protein [Magnetococcales bacterium]